MKNKTWSEHFSPEGFRKNGHRLVDQLADYIDHCVSEEGQVTNYIPPDDEYTFWSNYEYKGDQEFYRDCLQRTMRLMHPRYMGHQVSAPLPDLALCGLVSELLNNGMGIYEMGQAPTAMEKIVTEEMASLCGLGSDSGGFLTSGGTLANLSALLAARAKIQPQPNDSLVILVSDQAHFCIERAASTMGIPVGNVIKVPSTNEYKMDLGLLFQLTSKTLEAGNKVLAVVGCACSTATGSYDDLGALADFCEEQKFWLHIDGAHGGAAVLSPKYKALVKGLGRADSIVIDAHKMMLTPALATFVFFKNGSDAYRSFGLEAEYLFESKEDEWYNLTKRTYETTKYMMSTKLFWLFRARGIDLAGDFVTRQYDLTRKFADMIRSRAFFILGHEPMSNILCFKYERDLENVDWDNFNSKLRQTVLEEGQYYIVQTKLSGSIFLRVTLMNPLTSEAHLNNLLDHIEETASKMLS